eukprot:271408-Hanusia_phi.AAC.1
MRKSSPGKIDLTLNARKGFVRQVNEARRKRGSDEEKKERKEMKGRDEGRRHGWRTKGGVDQGLMLVAGFAPFCFSRSCDCLRGDG